MFRVLIPYGTTEGLTARISEYVAEVVRGHEADTVDLKGSVGPEPDDYDAVIVGASIHMGKHEVYVLDFVRENRETLERLPSAFFTVIHGRPRRHGGSGRLHRGVRAGDG